MEDTRQPEHLLGRRAFTGQSILALLSGATVTIVGCDGDDSPTSPTPQGDVTGSISANHGHTAVVTDAQIMAGNAVVLNIRGSAAHPHTVELSMQQIDQIGAGQRVSQMSSADDSADFGRHSHAAIFN